MPRKADGYQRTRNEEIKRIQQKMPEFAERLKWTREQILAAQQEGLRKLLTHAKQFSDWHRKRLADINEKTFTLDQLSRLPTMTKTDLMKNWDQIVTDKTLTLEKANDFLDHAQPEQPQLFLDRLHVYATGGSSGQRGVFAWDREDFETFALAFFRYQFRDEFSRLNGKQALKVAVLTADHPVHMSTPLFSLPMTPQMEMHLIYATLPLPTMIEKLNALQPTHLIGYTSIIHRLAEEALRRGTLKIKPQRISVNSEPLFPQSRKLIEDAWRVPLTNMWGSTEGGPHAVSCDRTPCLHLTEDLLIFEPIDAKKQPVPAGKESHSLLLTNLINKTLPLIRYEMDDRVTLLDAKCACGAQYRLVDEIQGRMDDDFVYPGNIVVSTEVFESPLFSSPAVVEYQVLQRPNGAEILVVANSRQFDAQGIQESIQNSYKKLGIRDPQISIRPVAKIERHAITGKFKRYLPMASRPPIRI